jgi:hypothetical protein
MQGCKDMSFSISLYINICRNIDMYITYMTKAKKNKRAAGGIAWGCSDVEHVKF